MDHKIYKGQHWNGNVCVPFGKCSCGQYLRGQQAIDEHEEDND